MLTAVYDSKPDRIQLSHISAGVKVLPLEELRPHYADGRFDAVLIGVNNRKSRDEVAQLLADRGIPVVTLEEIQETVPPSPFLQAAFAEICMRGEQFQEKLPAIWEKLQDQESKELFLYRLYMAVTGNEQPFLDTIEAHSLARRHYMHDLKIPMARCDAKRIILFGGGRDGAVNLHALTLCEIPVAACCSLRGSDAGTDWPEERAELLITPEKLLRPEFEDCLVVVSSAEHRREIHQCLEEAGFPSERIYDPPSTWRPLLIGFRKEQYFDVWEAGKQEVFVDCGAYDGNTIRNFLKWTNRQYRAVLALEPLPEMQNIIRSFAEKEEIGHFSLFPAAAWNRKEQLAFSADEDLSSSSITDPANPGKNVLTVAGEALDELISMPVTYLKMDIEGSEMEAIRGAEGLIRAYRPRLAICVYHKTFDIWDIPLGILEIVPEYKFYVRHYSAGLYETVLYAEA